MCLVTGSRAKRIEMLAFVVIPMCIGIAATGCARPRGVVFEPIEPPRVWPAPPDRPRLRLVGTIASSADLKAGLTFKEGFLTKLRGPRPPIRFSRPQAIAIREPDLVAVADAGGSAVHILDLTERTHVMVSGWDDERFAIPVGIVWVGGRLFITDAKRGEVIELNAQGGYHGRFGGPVLQRPVGIAYVALRNQLYVVDGGAGHVVVFDLAGKLVRTFGQVGTKKGQFNHPTHIGCAGDKLLVADSGNFRVQVMDLDGNCLRTIGQKGDGAGDFALPKGVAFDNQGHIYVVDAQFENVQIFNADGQLLMAFGSEGRELGRFWLPAGIAIDSLDRIWVADSGNRRLEVFQALGSAS